MTEANPLSVYDPTAPNIRSTKRRCAKCGATGTGQLRTTEGPWRLSMSKKHILCGDCWELKYFTDPITMRTALRKNAVEAEINGRAMMVDKANTLPYTCPISGASYVAVKSENHGDINLVELRPAPSDILHSRDWCYSVRFSPVLSKYAGLFYVAGQQPVLPMQDRDGGLLVQDGRGRQYTFSMRHQSFLFKIEDCEQIECGKWVHVTEKNHYARRCAVTQEIFYSSARVKFSKKGEDLMRRKDISLCSSCGKPAKPGDSMVQAGNMVCMSCAQESGSIYYDGCPQPPGTGRTIGVELELEVCPDGQLKVQKIPGVDVQASDMLKRPVTMNLPPVSAHEDGSLRGKHPVEYVSPILHESNYVGWLSNLCNAIKGNTRVYSRAGLHAHFGTSDFSWLDILKLGCHAQQYERLYASMVAPSRWNNNFVTHLPDFIYASKFIHSKADFMLWFYGKKCIGRDGKKSRRANEMQNRAFPNGVVHRYQWLNLHSHVFRRTVEVRLHHATAQEEKIANWCALWLNVINHIGSGGDWAASPLDLASGDLRVYYQRRMDKFSAMVDSNGLSLDHTHPVGHKRARGLLATKEKWARAQSDTGIDGDAFQNRQVALLTLRQRFERQGEATVEVPMRLVDGMVRDMNNWTDTIAQLLRHDDEEAPVGIHIYAQPEPGERQRVFWSFDDGSTDLIHDQGARRPQPQPAMPAEWPRWLEPPPNQQAEFAPQEVMAAPNPGAEAVPPQPIRTADALDMLGRPDVVRRTVLQRDVAPWTFIEEDDLPRGN